MMGLIALVLSFAAGAFSVVALEVLELVQFIEVLSEPIRLLFRVMGLI